MTLGPAVRDGEQVFGVVHIFASFNDTFIVLFLFYLSPISIISLEVYVKLTYIVVSDTFLQHVTDLSGRETLVRITGQHLFIENTYVIVRVLFSMC